MGDYSGPTASNGITTATGTAPLTLGFSGGSLTGTVTASTTPAASTLALWRGSADCLPARLSATGIDATALAATSLGTTLAGKTFFPLFAVVTVTAGSSFISVASVSIGTNSASFDNILGITVLTGIGGVGKTLCLPLGATAISSVTASTGVSVKVTTGAVATGITMDVHLFGFYV